MEAYSIHPLADIFPPMKEKKIDELAADIKEHGLREAIVLYEGMILDGRHRYRACAKLGIEPLTRQWDGKGDPLDYVVSKNVHRRHLTTGQRAIVADKIATRKQGARTDLAQICARSQPEAAELHNVSRRSLQNTKTVRENGILELYAAAEVGDVSVSAASEVAKMPNDRQREIVAGGPKKIAAAARRIRRRGRHKPKPAGYAQSNGVQETEHEKDLRWIRDVREGVRISAQQEFLRLAKGTELDEDDEEREEEEITEFTDADSYRAAILVRVDGALTMARNAMWAVENDPGDVTPAVAREIAEAARNAAKAWCALADRLEQSSSTEQLDRDSDPADQAPASAQRHVDQDRHPRM